MNKSFVLIIILIFPLDLFSSKRLSQEIGMSFFKEVETALGKVSNKLYSQKQLGGCKGIKGWIGQISYFFFLHCKFESFSEKEAKDILGKVHGFKFAANSWIEMMLRFVNDFGFKYDFSQFVGQYIKEPHKYPENIFYLYLSAYVEFFVNACAFDNWELPFALQKIRRRFFDCVKEKAITDECRPSYFQAKKIISWITSVCYENVRLLKKQSAEIKKSNQESDQEQNNFKFSPSIIKKVKQRIEDMLLLLLKKLDKSSLFVKKIFDIFISLQCNLLYRFPGVERMEDMKYHRLVKIEEYSYRYITHKLCMLLQEEYKHEYQYYTKKKAYGDDLFVIRAVIF